VTEMAIQYWAVQAVCSSYSTQSCPLSKQAACSLQYF